MHTKKWLWRLDYWHWVKALLSGWDVSPSPYIKILFVCYLCSDPLGGQSKTPLTYEILILSQRICTAPISHPGLLVLPSNILISEYIHLSRTQAQLRKHQGSSLLFVFLSSAGAVLDMGETPGALWGFRVKSCSREINGSFAIDFSGAGLHS